ncbi:NrfD/PsrC family molybdoenzyme membrane anchor subunit [Chloroflexota bacterium]
MSLGEMSWNWQIWIDLWAAGMAGGAYLVAFLANKYSGGKYNSLFRLAVLTGVPLAIIGVFLLIIDLGTPIWAWHLFVSFLPVAVMSMGTWILFAWIVVAFIMMVLWVVEWDANRNPNKYSGGTVSFFKNLSGMFAWVGFIFAILLMTYTGVLLASTTQALWSDTLLLPALFVVSAVTTGVALLLIMTMILNKVNAGRGSGWTFSDDVTGKLVKSLIGLIVIEAVVMAGYAIWLALAGDAGSEAFKTLVSGDLAVAFWVAVVGVGLVVPLLLLLVTRGRNALFAVATSASCVVLGGLALRAVITVGGQL